MHEISVDDLAKGAGISRSTFYFYFPSKDAVLMTLLKRVIAAVDVAWEKLLAIRRKTATSSGGPASRSSTTVSAPIQRCREPVMRFV